MPKKSRNGCKSFLILRKFSRRTCFPLFSSCTWELMKSFNIYKQSNWVYTFTTSRCEPWSGWIPQAFLSYNVYYFRKVTRSMTWFIFFISLPNFEYHILNQLNHKSSVWNIHKPLKENTRKCFLGHKFEKLNCQRGTQNTTNVTWVEIKKQCVEIHEVNIGSWMSWWRSRITILIPTAWMDVVWNPLSKGRFTLRWRSPPVMHAREFLKFDWPRGTLLSGGGLHYGQESFGGEHRTWMPTWRHFFEGEVLRRASFLGNLKASHTELDLQRTPTWIFF